MNEIKDEARQPLAVTLESVGSVSWSPERRNEPVTVGLPLPAGAIFSAQDIGLEDGVGRSKPVQARALDRWPDGSIRWVLIDCLVDAQRGRAQGMVLRLGPARHEPLPAPLQVTTTAEGVQITTGRATFGFSRGGSFPLSQVVAAGGPRMDLAESGLRVEHNGTEHRFRISDVSIDEVGPLRVAVEVRGSVDRGGRLPLEVWARIEAFALSATLRVALTLRNPRRASHRGGVWPLGDEGSVFLTSASLVLKIEDQVAGVECAAELNDSLAAAQTPFEIHQESSGGEHWNGPVHKNRHGQVSLRFRGYRRRDGEVESLGQRATPVVIAHTSQGPLSVAVPKFWENFPRAVAVRDSLVEIGLFPRGCADIHELQGGEQKTHVAVIAFAPDAVSDPPLAWVHEPLLAYPTASWCSLTGAVPFLEAAGHDAGRAYAALVQQALDPREGFIAKREATDEFGWRNFGDLAADHESAFQPAGHTLVSHYNNQYDAVACFAIHFLRTGDRRWWQLMVDLASHVRDIDIYHTKEDKAAYSGGMFWHTLHYFDAGTSSHRTYPANGPGGGGPSAEHNYNLGLMLHHCLTGESASRREAIGLGEWVLAMEDGRRTVFRWLARGSTGLASQSGSPGYHGPGRGAANSILACLVAHRLTGELRFAVKVDELIRRSVHPTDDIEARSLLDAEQRWFYTMFLQALGVYLQGKTERGEFDDMFVYARESLLHYARWMTANERPYLDRREILEFPTETWPAQDMRKADVFFWAALYGIETERQRFLERARFFWNYSLTTLSGMPTSNYTRPIVLMLGNGLRLTWADRSGVPEPPVVPDRLQVPNWEPVRFEPQKARAVRRFVWAVAAAGLGLSLAGALLVFGRN